MRTLPLPPDPVARLWHGANLLREHRGDGHVAALLTVGIGGPLAILIYVVIVAVWIAALVFSIRVNRKEQSGAAGDPSTSRVI